MTERTAQLLTVRDFAEAYRVSVPTVYRILKRGDLPPLLKIGRASRIRATDAEAWASRLGGKAVDNA